MNILILIAALTMSTNLTFENEDRSALTVEQSTWAKVQCRTRELERVTVVYNENGIRSITCYSLTDPEVDINS